MLYSKTDELHFVGDNGIDNNVTGDVVGLIAQWALINTRVGTLEGGDQTAKVNRSGDEMSGALDISSSSAAPMGPGLTVAQHGSSARASIMIEGNDNTASGLGESYIDFRTGLGLGSQGAQPSVQVAYEGYEWRIGQNDNTYGIMICQHEKSSPSVWDSSTTRAAMVFDPSGQLEVNEVWFGVNQRLGSFLAGDIYNKNIDTLLHNYLDK